MQPVSFPGRFCLPPLFLPPPGPIQERLCAPDPFPPSGPPRLLNFLTPSILLHPRSDYKPCFQFPSVSISDKDLYHMERALATLSHPRGNPSLAEFPRLGDIHIYIYICRWSRCAQRWPPITAFCWWSWEHEHNRFSIDESCAEGSQSHHPRAPATCRVRMQPKWIASYEFSPLTSLDPSNNFRQFIIVGSHRRDFVLFCLRYL